MPYHYPDGVIMKFSLQVMEKVDGRWLGHMFKTFTWLIQTSMMLHLSAGVIIVINPVFLHLEHFLNVPKGMLLSLGLFGLMMFNKNSLRRPKTFESVCSVFLCSGGGIGGAQYFILGKKIPGISPGAITWTCTKILSGIFLLISFLKTL